MASSTLDLFKRHKTRHRGISYREKADGSRTYYLFSAGSYIACGPREGDALRKRDELGGRRDRGQPIVVPTKVTFAEYAERWLERRRLETNETRTIEHAEWGLAHLLPYFGKLRLSDIKVAHVDSYMTAKLNERKKRGAEIAEWEGADLERRGRKPVKGLSNDSINKTVKVLGQILGKAVKEEILADNVARRTERLKAGKPKRTWLKPYEVKALLDAAGTHRALLATMILAGLRVSELAALRWRSVDLAAGKIAVQESKTDAGARVVNVSAMLRDDLALHRHDSERTGPDDLVFGTSNGTERNRSNITRQILQPAIDRANVALTKAGKPRIEGVTNHSLRRTFCALLFEAGKSPRYAMEQMGHTDAKLALEVYAKVIGEEQGAGDALDTLIRDAELIDVPTEPVAVPSVVES